MTTRPITLRDFTESALELQRRLGVGVEELPENLYAFQRLARPRAQAGDPYLGAIFAGQDVMLQSHGLAMWLRSGMPVFRPSKDLAAGLALTDPSDVAAGEVHWPFHTFMTHVPYDFWRIEGPPPDYVSFVLMSQYTSPFGEARWTIHAYGRDGFTLYSHHPAPTMDTPLGEWMSLLLHELPDRAQLAFDLAIDPADYATLPLCARLAFNLCLYIAERGRGQRVQQHTTKAARRRGREQERKPAVWEIGREIKLDRETIASASIRAAGDLSWRLRSRFQVRGHFRMQPHGPGRELRRRQWIMPFWKGPREGTRLSHLYTTGDDE